MARIVVGSYLVRYPLGGMMSYVLQYLRGFAALGHEVWFVEKGTYPNACYDPVADVMTDDPTTGIAAARPALRQIGLGERWCFVDYAGRYHGADRRRIEDVLRSADLFIDMGTHGSWLDEVRRGPAVAVLLDGEPGYTQIRLETRRRAGEPVDHYDAYYTNGWNIGTDRSPAPTAGVAWGHLPHPVDTSSVPFTPPPAAGPVVALMNWQSHAAVEFEGRSYGQKDVEFPHFMALPHATSQALELAVSGTSVPHDELVTAGWLVRDAHEVTATLPAFHSYVTAALAEFSVCKNVFVALRTGWFSDRSAYFLAAGRPVVMQDTGFSEHLPTGSGLFAVHDVDGAAAAIDEVRRDSAGHGRVAREIACDLLDARRVLGAFLDDVRSLPRR